MIPHVPLFLRHTSVRGYFKANMATLRRMLEVIEDHWILMDNMSEESVDYLFFSCVAARTIVCTKGQYNLYLKWKHS